MAWEILGFSGVEKAANIYDGHAQALDHWWRAMCSVQSGLPHPAYTRGGAVTGLAREVSKFDGKEMDV